MHNNFGKEAKRMISSKAVRTRLEARMIGGLMLPEAMSMVSMDMSHGIMARRHYVAVSPAKPLFGVGVF